MGKKNRRSSKKLSRLLAKFDRGEITEHELERQMRRFDDGTRLQIASDIQLALEQEGYFDNYNDQGKKQVA